MRKEHQAFRFTVVSQPPPGKADEEEEEEGSVLGNNVPPHEMYDLPPNHAQAEQLPDQTPAWREERRREQKRVEEELQRREREERTRELRRRQGQGGLLLRPPREHRRA